VKLKDTVWLILLVVVLLSGCHKHAFKVTYIVAPSHDLAIAYAEPGATIEWYADPALGAGGSDFTVYTNLPCKGLVSGQLKSDSKHTVTCHLISGQTGSFAISFDSGGTDKGGSSSAGPPPVVMHVGPCTGCAKGPGKPKVAALQNGPVVLDCDPSTSTPQSRARPSPVQASVGDTISWNYAAGSYPPKFTVTLPVGICSDTTTTTITQDSNSCTALKATGAAVTYDIVVPSCKVPNGTGSILITP
jgi:hypothetical protein